MDEIWKFPPSRFLIGDAAYELTEHLLTPYTGSQQLDQGKDALISTCHRSELELRWHLDD